nr:hypothetical protein [Pseudoxanthomonas sp.]
MPILDPDELPEPRDGIEAFEALDSFARLRTLELAKMFEPVVALTDDYASLMSRLVWELRDSPPTDDQDRVVRDLMADAFDFLLAWRRAVLEAQLTVGYPLARRAYESLSLMAACAQDSTLAAQWHEGKEIKNASIRKALAVLPMAESEGDLKSLYAFFSKGAHPNRELIPSRFLGEGNGFVLGSIGSPNLLLVVDHLLHLVSMWFWLVAATGFHYRRVTDRSGREWGRDYLAVSARAKEVAAWLTDAYNQLLDIELKERPGEKLIREAGTDSAPTGAA